MSKLIPRIVLAASCCLLVGVGIAFATGGFGAPRSDLAGKETDLTNSGDTESPASWTAGQDLVLRPPTTLAPSTLAPTTVVSPPVQNQAPSTQPSTLAPVLRSFPKRINIPILSIDAPVVAVGLEPDGTMEIPGANEVGWYHYGSSPGDAMGSAVIAGHVDFRQQPGVFLNLRELNVGAQINITDDSGEVITYRVTERFQTNKVDLPGTELFRTDGDHLLTLITCGGEFNKRQRSYSDNIIIRAEPTPS
jgi:LPXTG-site transpeptidase (sortase) family protein